MVHQRQRELARCGATDCNTRLGTQLWLVMCGKTCRHGLQCVVRCGAMAYNV